MRVALVRPRGSLQVRPGPRRPWPLRTTTSPDIYEFVATSLLAAGHEVTLVGSKVVAPKEYRVGKYQDAPPELDAIVGFQTPWKNAWNVDEESTADTVGAYRWLATGAPLVWLSDDPAYAMSFPEPEGWDFIATFPSKRGLAEIAPMSRNIPRPIPELVKVPALVDWVEIMAGHGTTSEKRDPRNWDPTWWNASCTVKPDAPWPAYEPVASFLPAKPVYISHNRPSRARRIAAIAQGVPLTVVGNWKPDDAEKAFGRGVDVHPPVVPDLLGQYYRHALCSLCTVDAHMAGLAFTPPRLWDSAWHGCPAVVDRAIWSERWPVLDGFQEECTSSPQETRELVRRFGADELYRRRAVERQRAALDAYPHQRAWLAKELDYVLAQARERV